MLVFLSEISKDGNIHVIFSPFIPRRPPRKVAFPLITASHVADLFSECPGGSLLKKPWSTSWSKEWSFYESLP